jgi:hypothetical protein
MPIYICELKNDKYKTSVQGYLFKKMSRKEFSHEFFIVFTKKTAAFFAVMLI